MLPLFMIIRIRSVKQYLGYGDYNMFPGCKICHLLKFRFPFRSIRKRFTTFLKHNPMNYLYTYITHFDIFINIAKKPKHQISGSTLL